jgi:hypothetical protein
VRARVDVHVEPDSALAGPLQAGQEYYLAKFLFAPPSSMCLAWSCEHGACFVINDFITLTHTGGTTEIPMSYSESYAYWQNGVPGCPFIISVEDASWGWTKAQYR